MNVRPHSAHTPPANPCGQLVPLWLTVTAAAARLRLYRDEFPHPFLRARRRFFGHGGATTATAGDWSIAPLTRCVSGSTTCRRNDPPSLLGTVQVVEEPLRLRVAETGAKQSCCGVRSEIAQRVVRTKSGSNASSNVRQSSTCDLRSEIAHCERCAHQTWFEGDVKRAPIVEASCWRGGC